MTVDVEQCEKFLAYDGDCPMCTSTVAHLIRLGLIKPEQARSNHDLDARDNETARAAGIRNQLVVIDPCTREVRSGSDALLWILRDTTGNRLWVRVLGLPGFRQMLRWGYQAISYNRRIISPPRHQIVCDCEPEVTVARRLSLVLPLVLLSILMTAAFGAAAFHAWQLGDAWSGVLFAEIAVGVAWLLLALAAIARMEHDKPLDYFAHLVVTTFIGALVLLPAAMLALILPANVSIAVTCFAALASFAIMVSMQRRRVGALKLSLCWLGGWVLSLVVGFGLAAWLML